MSTSASAAGQVRDGDRGVRRCPSRAGGIVTGAGRQDPGAGFPPPGPGTQLLGSVLAFVAVLTVVAPACSKDLSQGRANEILKEWFAKGQGKAWCTWRASGACPIEVSPGRWACDAEQPFDRPCLLRLEGQGIIELGECLEGGCGTQVVTPRGHDAELGPAISFSCGTVEFLGVSAVRTDGNKATVKYRKRVVLDQEIIGQVSPLCRLSWFEPGETEQSCEMRRDDAGNWSRGN